MKLSFFLDYRKRIASGETSLEELASTESDCSSARQGGDLGFFGRGKMQSMYCNVFRRAYYCMNTYWSLRTIKAN